MSTFFFLLHGSKFKNWNRCSNRLNWRTVQKKGKNVNRPRCQYIEFNSVSVQLKLDLPPTGFHHFNFFETDIIHLHASNQGIYLKVSPLHGHFKTRPQTKIFYQSLYGEDWMGDLQKITRLSSPPRFPNPARRTHQLYRGAVKKIRKYQRHF